MALGDWMKRVEPLKRLKKIILFLVFIAFLISLMEIGSRVYWTSRRDVPFLSPVNYYYYPELKKLDKKTFRKNDRHYDILLLGGSVLHENWGNIGHLLLEKMTYATKKPIKVYNLAQPGHTSLDSYYKYRRLADKPFDLVIIYHGINEVRLNNCPPSLFRDNYSHYSWYRIINRFESENARRTFALPFSLWYTGVRGLESMKEKLGFAPDYVSRKMPRAEWLTHGSDIKSAGAFEDNLKKIVAIAESKQEPLLLMTFCSYVPQNYSLERFEEQRLDYCLYDSPIEIWGTPKNVMAGIKAHNDVIRSLTQANKGVTLIDQNALIPKERLYFNDICHLTHRGCERFVDNILKAVP